MLEDSSPHDTARYVHGMERLIEVVRDLSLARTLGAVQEITKRAARELAGADGASFVLRDGDLCFYADEDAIGPLWKGLRFPMPACVSGWAMLHREVVVIPDIYADPRVPVDAYRPTFVKSMAMVPIRITAPIGAIGAYWAAAHHASDVELKLLQALADSTSIALENVQVYGELEKRVEERTRELADANRELEAFSYSVSHDLRAPLRVIDGLSYIVATDYGDKLGDEARGQLQRVRASAQRMASLVDDILTLSRISRAEVRRDTVDVSALARRVFVELEQREPARQVTFEVADGITANGDKQLIAIALENLLGNAWKFTSARPQASITLTRTESAEGATFAISDNGAGFDMAGAEQLFKPFQRLHDAARFEGTGIGLATVHRIVTRHGGRIWAHAAIDTGATFYFTLGRDG
jgi:signal transduction histidine kinase